MPQPQPQPGVPYPYGQPYPAGFPQFVQQPIPGPYYPPAPTPYSAPWPPGSSTYNPGQQIPHPHANTGAVYASQPPGAVHGNPESPERGFMDERPNHEGGGSALGGGENPLHMLHHHLKQAIEHLARHLSGGGKPAMYEPDMNTPADSPFPPMHGGMPPPGMGGAMGGGMGGNTGGMPGHGMGGQSPGMDYRYAAGYSYGRNGQPVPTTISGLPVGYQLKIDQLQYQLNQSQQAIQTLLADRDRADTDACVAQIRQLAAVGYQVGDVEVNELKNRPRDQRDAYLQNIATKYQRIGTEPMPMAMGDPTPGPSPDAARPATQDEMERALKITQQNPQIPYTDALLYARGIQPNNGPAMGPMGQPNGPMNPSPYGGMPDGRQTNFVDPYEPSNNGNGGW